MDRRLVEAERSVTLGFELIAEQRQLASGAEAWGHQSAETARYLLWLFQERQDQHLQDLEQAIAQIDADNERQRLSLKVG